MGRTHDDLQPVQLPEHERRLRGMAGSGFSRQAEDQGIEAGLRVSVHDPSDDVG
jgi:hypothetical protein